MTDKLQIAFVVPEVDELHKTGGLGDYGGSLSRTLTDLGHQVQVFLPHYKGIDASNAIRSFTVHVDGKEVPVHTVMLKGGTPVHLIGSDSKLDPFFDSTVYGSSLITKSGSYHTVTDDSDVRNVAVFSKAVLETTKLLRADGFKPDIFHCNDWPSALIPFYLRNDYKGSHFDKAGIVYTMHNKRHRGNFTTSSLKELITTQSPESLEEALRVEAGKYEFNEGRKFADVVTTVSPTYAREIKVPWGIINGLDSVNWDPTKILDLQSNTVDEVVEQKAVKRKELQAKYGLNQENSFLICYMHRFCPQKSTEALKDALQHILLFPGTQFIAAGGTDKSLLDKVLDPQGRAVNIGRFVGKEEEELLYAGSTALLMPSIEEPCGYSQLKAMAVGTVPIVTATGGLLDTVQEYSFDSPTGNGFFIRELGKTQFAQRVASRVMEVALIHRQPEKWQEVVANGYRTDSRWDRENGPVQKYLQLYRGAMDMRSP